MLSHVEIQQEQNALIACLQGEIDHHTVQEMRKRIDAEVLCSEEKKLILDFGGVTFMDSSGVGLVLGRSKLMESLGGTLAVRHTPVQMEPILKLAGVSHIESREGEYAR